MNVTKADDEAFEFHWQRFLRQHPEARRTENEERAVRMLADMWWRRGCIQGAKTMIQTAVACEVIPNDPELMTELERVSGK